MPRVWSDDKDEMEAGDILRKVKRSDTKPRQSARVKIVGVKIVERDGRENREVAAAHT